jgi:hypothetical protein
LKREPRWKRSIIYNVKKAESKMLIWRAPTKKYKIRGGLIIRHMDLALLLLSGKVMAYPQISMIRAYSMKGTRGGSTGVAHVDLLI